MDPVLDPYRQAAAQAVSGAVGPGDTPPTGPPSGPGGAGIPGLHPMPPIGGPPAGGPGLGGPGGVVGPNPQLVVPGQQQRQPAQADQTAINQHLQERLAGLTQAVQSAGGSIFPFSIARTQQDQEAMYRRAVDKYGDEKVAGQYVSKPGTSHHEVNAGLRYGLGPGAVGADLRGDLAIASRLAAMYGLEFSDKNNPWHVSLAGLR